MDKTLTENKHYSLILNDGENLALDGVSELISFGDTQIALDGTFGTLTILGEGLHMGNLDVENGKVKVSGRITSLDFGERENAKESLLSRLFG
ncbi:MAG: sporulation protein YabP [Clostridia bacterium]|nr:sporulation protein YabP [Clostridia bacterium]